VFRLSFAFVTEDFETPNWTAERLYNEFYVLEQKLKEFHGKFYSGHRLPCLVMLLVIIRVFIVAHVQVTLKIVTCRQKKTIFYAT
jgi:hypothetical protein